jgi:hypothetical protein
MYPRIKEMFPAMAQIGRFPATETIENSLPDITPPLVEFLVKGTVLFQFTAFFQCFSSSALR